ncbi:Parvalbumin, partial [Parasponia andersonii]
MVLGNVPTGSKVKVNSRESDIPWTNEQLTEVFRSYDSDNDGQHSRDELKAAFKYLGSHCSYFRTARALSSVDVDNH